MQVVSYESPYRVSIAISPALSVPGTNQDPKRSHLYGGSQQAAAPALGRAPRCGLAPALGLWVVVTVREPSSARRPFSPSPQPSRTRDHDPGASRPNTRSGKATLTIWRTRASPGCCSPRSRWTTRTCASARSSPRSCARPSPGRVDRLARARRRRDRAARRDLHQHQARASRRVPRGQADPRPVPRGGRRRVVRWDARDPHRAGGERRAGRAARVHPAGRHLSVGAVLRARYHAADRAGRRVHRGAARGRGRGRAD